MLLEYLQQWSMVYRYNTGMTGIDWIHWKLVYGFMIIFTIKKGLLAIYTHHMLFGGEVGE